LRCKKMSSRRRWRVDSSAPYTIIAPFVSKTTGSDTRDIRDMRFEVDRLTEQGEAFAHGFAPDELTLGEDGVSLVGAACVEGRISRKGEQVRLRGRVKAGIEALCDRCLQPVSLPVEVEFDDRYVPAQTELELAEATELQADDLDLAFYEGETIEVGDIVREKILLALPTRLLCREDCKGLCPTCGADLNREACACERREVDPRWAALADLKKK
jgi:uncharacterized protein